MKKIKTKDILWKDIKIGDKFVDGSKVTQIHEIHKIGCYKLFYGKLFNTKHITLSKDHFLLCDISNMKNNLRLSLLKLFEYHTLAKEGKCHLYTEKDLSNEDQMKIIYSIIKNEKISEGLLKDINYNIEETKKESVIEDENNIWLSVENIAWLVSNNHKIYCNSNKIKKAYWRGEKLANCVSTNTGRYLTKDLIHHNSVTLRNIIFHCLTHSYEWGIGLVDLKLTEFSQFKDINGVVGVANTVFETVELLRVAREVLYKRNRLLSEKGIVDIVDYKPEEPTDMVWISGREIHEDTILKIKINHEEKEMTSKDLLNYFEGV